jgi:phosphatidylglycerophosphate synthase
MAYDKIEEMPNRRPVGARKHPLFTKAAIALQRMGILPNQVSILSIVFAALAGCAMAASPRVATVPAVACFLGAIVGVALRGTCNVLDGLIAVEGGLKSPSGDVYNDFPDRISDVFLYVGAGYGITTVAWGPELGWAAALLAVMTAYVRVLGGSVGASTYFIGPMAKTHRMATLVVSCLAAAVERAMSGTNWSLVAGLVIICLGSVITVARRASRIVRELESR